MPSPRPAVSVLRSAAADAGTAPVAFLSRLLRGPLAGPDRPGPRHTLLAVCPNSEAVARAALRAAQSARAPLLFAATLNQVDRDGGYTGWTPAAFAQFVDKVSDQLDLTVPVFLGLDHGGPWKKDAHVRRGLDADAAWTATKRSITACVEAGYDLLHLDPTAPGPGADAPVPVDGLVDRTVALMHHAEAARADTERGPVAYEVGVEETGGPGRDERFRAFLDRLDDALADTDLPRPSFVVGDVGTRPGSSGFDAPRARRLVDAAEAFGALVKGHYTDDVAAPEQYPLCGVGGANVGPGLAAAEANALRNLAALERRLDRDSGLPATLRTAVIDDGRWPKWLPPDEEPASFDALPAERQRWIVDTGSRYVWTDPRVEDARTALYEHVSPYRDADAFVLWRLDTALQRYLHAFNLVGLADRLAEAASAIST